MEIFASNLPEGTRVKTNEAYYTFVAVDADNNPKAVPVLIPETDIEHKAYKDALQRRELRLILAGKLKPENAKKLKALVSLFSQKN